MRFIIDAVWVFFWDSQLALYFPTFQVESGGEVQNMVHCVRIFKGDKAIDRAVGLGWLSHQFDLSDTPESCEQLTDFSFTNIWWEVTDIDLPVLKLSSVLS